MSDAEIRRAVKDKYGKAALKVAAGGSACCASVPLDGSRITINSYWRPWDALSKKV